MANTNPSALISPQLGLLEDDIVYRLSMLAVNVLQPLKNQFPNIVIISGFRQPNTGVSQHELAEAVDIQLRNETDAEHKLVNDVADWIQKNLIFDQLIVNFSNIGDGGPWIHLSFSTTSNRQQVLTKDYADSFHDGLWHIEPLEGEEAAQALRTIQDQQDAIGKELTDIQTRQTRLSPTTNNIDDMSTGSGGSGGAGAPVTLPTQGGPNGTVQFDHDWTGKVELKLREILSTGIAGPDGSNGQAVIDQMNTLGPPYSGAEFQLQHDGTGYRTYGFPWFYVSYIPADDGTGEYQLVEFGIPPSTN